MCAWPAGRRTRRKGAVPIIETLRKLFNAVEEIADRKALIEPQTLSVTADGEAVAVTARRAYRLCEPIAREFDSAACLKMITTAAGNVRNDGSSIQWDCFSTIEERYWPLECRN